MARRRAPAPARPTAARTVSARAAATATASSAVSCSTASSQCGSCAASSSRRLRERSERSSAVTRPECCGVDRQHQAVEKAPPLGGRAVEQRVHRGRQPDHAQMIGEGRGRGDRLAVDAAFARAARRPRRPAARCRCRAWRGRARLRPRQRPPRSRRLRRKRPPRAWRGAGRGPGARSEIASIRLVLPAPFGPVSTTGLARPNSNCAA